jgi:hypothetical protein
LITARSLIFMPQHEVLRCSTPDRSRVVVSALTTAPRHSHALINLSASRCARWYPDALAGATDGATMVAPRRVRADPRAPCVFDAVVTGTGQCAAIKARNAPMMSDQDMADRQFSS